MPIIKSAQKRERQNIKRRTRLKPFKSKMLTFVKNIIKIVQEGDLEKAKKLIPTTYSAIDTAVKKNIIHKNTASRRKSLVQRAINSAQKKKKVSNDKPQTAQVEKDKKEVKEKKEDTKKDITDKQT